MIYIYNVCKLINNILPPFSLYLCLLKFVLYCYRWGIRLISNHNYVTVVEIKKPLIAVLFFPINLT